jgi:HEAT repeat protein
VQPSMTGKAPGSLLDIRSQLVRDLIVWYRALIDHSNKIEWRRGDLGPLTLKTLLVNVGVFKERWQRLEHAQQDTDHVCQLPGRYGEDGQQDLDLELDTADMDPAIARVQERLVRRTRPMRVPWKDQLPMRENAVILGGPGGGKSILAAATALQTAEEELEKLVYNRADLNSVKLPVFIKLQYFPRGIAAASLDEIVVSMMRRFLPLTPRLEKWIKGKLFTKECLWILDGLDQVSGDNAGDVDKWLEEIEKSPSKAVVTCRTQGFASRRAPGKSFTQYELAPFTTPEIGNFVDNWFGAGNSQGSRLLTLIQDNHSLEDGCSSPLVATFVCLVSDAITRDTTRADLYRVVIDRLQSKDGKSGSSDGQLGSDFREMQKLAWRLFSERPEENLFTRDQFFSALAGKSTGPAGKFLDRLINCRLLVKSGLNASGEQQYSFIHRTILEFLAAKYMAEVVKEKGWGEARVSMPEDRSPVLLTAVLERRSWAPAWAAAIVFFSGCLRKELRQVVDLLWRDPVDIGWCRRALALECLAGARAKDRHHEQVDEISAQAFSFLWSVTEAKTQALISGYESSCKSLAQLNGHVGEGEVRVMGRLFARASEGIETANDMLEAIGSAASRHPDAIKELLSTLARDTEDKEVYEGRVEAWGRTQRRAANTLWCTRKAVERHATYAVQPLVALFKKDVYFMRMCAIHRLWAEVAGVAARRRGVISQILESLNAKEPEGWEGGWNFHSWHFERCWGAIVLGYMGELAGNDDRVIPALLKRIKHDLPQVMGEALKALTCMPEAAARHEDAVPSIFESFLTETDLLFHTDSLPALTRFGPFAARHFSTLVPLLIKAAVYGEIEPDGSPSVGLQMRSVFLLGVMQRCALEKLGDAGMAEFGDAVGALRRTLKAPEYLVRREAVKALRDIATSTGRDDVAQDLVRLLSEDPEPSVRVEAATALGCLGYFNFHDCTPDLIRSLFSDPDPDVQRVTAEALGKCGEPALRHPEFLAKLLAMLQSGSTPEMKSALIALRDLGSAAANDGKVIPALLDCFASCEVPEILELVADALLSMKDNVKSRASTIKPLLLPRFRENPRICVRRGVIRLFGLLSAEDLSHAELRLLRECLREGFNDEIQKEAANALVALSRTGYRFFEQGKQLELQKIETLSGSSST